MGERIVEGKFDAQAAWEALLGGLEVFFQRRVAAREHHQLHAQAHHRVERVAEQVDALLRRHPRYHPDNRPVLAVAEPHEPAQSAPADHLALGPRARVTRRDHRIDSRVPFGVIRSVENTDNTLALVPQHAFETETELGIAAHLARVGRTYGRDAVGEHDRTLHEIYPAPEFQAFHRVVGAVDIEQAEILRVEDSLEGEIMHSEDG